MLLEKDTIKALLSTLISERLGAVFCQGIVDKVLNYVIVHSPSNLICMLAAVTNMCLWSWKKDSWP